MATKRHLLRQTKVAAAQFSTGCGLHVSKISRRFYSIDTITSAPKYVISTTKVEKHVTCRVCRALINKNGATYKNRCTTQTIEEAITRYINDTSITDNMLAKEYNVSNCTIRRWRSLAGVVKHKRHRSKLTPLDIINIGTKYKENPLITDAALAKEYNVSSSTIYRWRMAKGITTHRINRINKSP